MLLGFYALKNTLLKTDKIKKQLFFSFKNEHFACLLYGQL